MEEINNIVPFLLFSILLFHNYKVVGRIITLSNFIILLYSLSMLSFFILTTIYKMNYYYNTYALAIIFFTIYFMILPLRNFEKYSKSYKLNIIKPQKLKIFSKFIILLCLYAIGFFLMNLGKAIAFGVVELRNNLDALYESSIFSKTAILGAFASPIALFLYFYNQVNKYLNNFYSILLLIGSSSFVLYTLNVAGRDGIIIWFFSYFACISLFYDFLPKKQLKTNIRNIFFASILMMPILFFISNERFSSTDSGTIISMIDYLGQQLYFLSLKIDQYLKTGVGNLYPLASFPLLKGIFIFFGYIPTQYENRFELMNAMFNAGYDSANRFSFFVGSFFPIYTSLPILIIFILTCVVIYKFNLKTNNNVISTRHLLCAFIWYLIPIVGVFYFYYGSLIGNVFLLLPFLIKLYLK